MLELTLALLALLKLNFDKNSNWANPNLFSNYICVESIQLIS